MTSERRGGVGSDSNNNNNDDEPTTATDNETSPNSSTSTSSRSNNSSSSTNTSPRSTGSSSSTNFKMKDAVDVIVDRNDENDESSSSRPKHQQQQQQQQQQDEEEDDDVKQPSKRTTPSSLLPPPDRELGPKYVDSSYLLTIPEEERQSIDGGGSSVAGDIGVITSLSAIPRRRGPGTIRSVTSSTGAMMITEDDDDNDSRIRNSKRRPLPAASAGGSGYNPESGGVAKTFRNFFLFPSSSASAPQQQQHQQPSAHHPTTTKKPPGVVVDSSSTFDMNSPDQGTSNRASGSRKSSGTRKREEDWKKQQDAKTSWYDFAKRNQTYLIVIAASILIIVVGIIVGIVLRNSEEGSSDDAEPTVSNPVLLDNYLNGYINKVYTKGSIEETDYSNNVFVNTSAPQYQARQWLLHNDSLFGTALSQGPIRILQRYALVVMYYSMNGPYWSLSNSTDDDEIIPNGIVSTTPYYFLLPTVHECEWTGVYCTSEWYDESFNYTRTENDVNKNYSDTTTTLAPSSTGTDGADPIFLLDPQQRRRRIVTEQLRRRWYYDSEVFDYDDDDDNVDYGYERKSWRRVVDSSATTTSNTNSITPSNVSIPDDVVLRVWMPRSNLTGTIPIDITAMDSLRDLDLSENQLRGSISDRFAEMLSDITLFDVSFNRLTGTIPSVLWTLPALSKLYLNDNNLTGRISDQLPLNSSTSTTSGSLKTLEKVWIQNNHITGPLPSWFTKLPNLRVWIAFNNNISGIFPSVTLPPLIEYIDFSNNQLSGSIPSTLWTDVSSPEYLSHLYLDNNRLTSVLPPTTASMANLRKVWLHNNNLSGTIPPFFAQTWKNITELTLHGNFNLTGIIGPDLTYIDDQFTFDMNLTAYNEAISTQCQTVWPLRELQLADCSDLLANQTPNVICSCCTNCPQ